MIEKRITWKDHNKQEHTETFYFHLTKPEVIRLQFIHKPSLAGYLQKLSKEEDGEGIIKFIEKIALDSYGIRSEDGASHIKTPETREKFANSPAYGELLMELCTNAELSAAFIEGVVPEGMREQLENITVPEQPQERPPNRAERRHPETRSAPPGPRPAISQERPDPTAPGVDPNAADWNVFQNPEPRILTVAEIEEMDAVELQQGLKEGRYKLQ